jgi:hypothetical protein
MTSPEVTSKSQLKSILLPVPHTLDLGGFPPHNLVFVEGACEVDDCQVVLLRKSIQVFGRKIAKAL